MALYENILIGLKEYYVALHEGGGPGETNTKNHVCRRGGLDDCVHSSHYMYVS